MIAVSCPHCGNLDSEDGLIWLGPDGIYCMRCKKKISEWVMVER